MIEKINSAPIGLRAAVISMGILSGVTLGSGIALAALDYIDSNYFLRGLSIGIMGSAATALFFTPCMVRKFCEPKSQYEEELLIKNNLPEIKPYSINL
jgi:hypothetical protein